VVWAHGRNDRFVHEGFQGLDQLAFLAHVIPSLFILSKTHKKQKN